MTTLVYKNGIVAYDSRMSNSRVILDNDYDKREVVGDYTFFFTGSPADKKRVIDSVVNDYHLNDDCDTLAFVHHRDQLYVIGYEKGKLWRFPLQPSAVYAIGSGAEHAWTAMDMGADAVKAVEMAKLRDPWTGGRVRFYRVFEELKCLSTSQPT